MVYPWDEGDTDEAARRERERQLDVSRRASSRKEGFQRDLEAADVTPVRGEGYSERLRTVRRAMEPVADQPSSTDLAASRRAVARKREVLRDVQAADITPVRGPDYSRRLEDVRRAIGPSKAMGADEGKAEGPSKDYTQADLTQEALDQLAQADLGGQVDRATAPLRPQPARQPMNLSLEDVGGPIQGDVHPINLSLEDVGGPIMGDTAPMTAQVQDAGVPQPNIDAAFDAQDAVGLSPGNHDAEDQQAEAQTAMDQVAPGAPQTRGALQPRQGPAGMATQAPTGSLARAMGRLSVGQGQPKPAPGPGEADLSSARDRDRARAVARAAIAFLAQAGAQRPIDAAAIQRTGDNSEEQAVLDAMGRSRQAEEDTRRQQIEGNQASMVQRQTQRQDTEDTRLAAMRDPGSDESRQAQEAAARIMPDMDFSGMSAERIDRALPGLTGGAMNMRVQAQHSQAMDEAANRKRDFVNEQNDATRQQRQAQFDATLQERIREFDSRHRAGHGGGDGGGGLQELADLARQQGIDLSPEQAQALGTRGVRNIVTQGLTAGARTSAQREARNQAAGIEGGRVPIMTDEQGGAIVWTTDRNVGPADIRQAHDAIRSARMANAALNTLDQVQRASAAGPLDPTLEAQLVGARGNLLAALGPLMNFGVLSDSEKERILNSLPNPENPRQWVLGTGNQYLQSQRGAFDQGLSARLGSISVPDEAIRTAVDFTHTGARHRAQAGAPAAGTPPPAGTTAYRSPTGTVWHLTSQQVAAAQQRGVTLEPVNGP